MSATDIAERFARETADHQMTVLHDDGLYRHLRFSSNPHGYGEYWFDLITWPDCLTIRGDYGNAYTFSRLPDMFEFFRGKRINPGYWSEKLSSGRNSVREYSEDVFRQVVREHVADAIRYSDAPRGISRAVRDDLLNGDDLHYEEGARAVLDDFEYEGFRFKDTWEWDFRDYSWSFLWACHAIVWGIARYDAARKQAAA